MQDKAILVLEDGTQFRGVALGQRGKTVGELVFNTAMTGYQEILSDCSYAGQIITFTYPHIGNTGINDEDFESDKIWAAGLVVREFPTFLRHWRATQTLEHFLLAQKIVGIAEIDTRALTQKLRQNGTCFGAIISEGIIDIDEAQHLAKTSAKKSLGDLTGLVSKHAPNESSYLWTEGSLWKQKAIPSFKVAVYDFGVKKNILRLLVDDGCIVKVFSAKTPIEEILSYQPQGIVLSNGPGDPAACHDAINKVRRLLKSNIPMLGICLGHQLLALSLGAKTKKLKFGHHGANHPVIDLTTNQVMVTSQNHNFVVDEDTLPSTLKITHRSLFDNSIQGMAHVTKPIFGFQGHPEASPGPHEAGAIIKMFINSIALKSSPQCLNV